MVIQREERERRALDLLLVDKDVTRALPAAEFSNFFDLGYHLKHIDTIFERVFGGVAIGVLGG